MDDNGIMSRTAGSSKKIHNALVFIVHLFSYRILRQRDYSLPRLHRIFNRKIGSDIMLNFGQAVALEPSL